MKFLKSLIKENEATQIDVLFTRVLLGLLTILTPVVFIFWNSTLDNFVNGLIVNVLSTLFCLVLFLLTFKSTFVKRNINFFLFGFLLFGSFSVAYFTFFEKMQVSLENLLLLSVIVFLSGSYLKLKLSVTYNIIMLTIISLGTIYAQNEYFNNMYLFFAFLFFMVVSIFLNVLKTRMEKRLFAEQLKLEKAEMLIKSRMEFISNMNHELRTPLHGILGNIQLLDETELDYDQKEYLSNIGFCGNHLLNIVEEILDIVKIEKGIIQLDKTEMDFNHIISNVLNSVKPTISLKGLNFIIDLDNSIKHNILCDEKKFTQILFNLLSNAIKFTDKGEISFTTRLIEKNETNYKVEIIIQDSGIGMETPTLEYAFIPFVQGDISKSKKYKGTGIGLTIVKKFVDIMNAEMKIDSIASFGTKISLKFNFEIAQ
jgi:signal transduction histidine kinase